MKKLEIIIRPEKLDVLKKILLKNNYVGMTVFAVMGCGHQKGVIKEFSGIGLPDINLLPKIYIMTVVREGDVENILADIHEGLSTGEVGDGKVFVSEIVDVMRIRTGDKGEKTL